MKRRRQFVPVVSELTAFAGFRFPPEVIGLAVRWYLRFGLSYRDLEELLAERGIEVDHVTLFRRVQRFTPLLVEAARPCRHAVGFRWFVDETYVKVSGRWRYVYRAVDEHGQVIDVMVSPRRDIGAAHRFFTIAITAHGAPDEVVTDLAPAFEHVIEELLPNAFHNTGNVRNHPSGRVVVTDDQGREVGHADVTMGTVYPADQTTVEATLSTALAPGHYRVTAALGDAALGISAQRDDLSIDVTTEAAVSTTSTVRRSDGAAPAPSDGLSTGMVAALVGAALLVSAGATAGVSAGRRRRHRPRQAA